MTTLRAALPYASDDAARAAGGAVSALAAIVRDVARARCVAGVVVRPTRRTP
jgi:hypothetical protein